MPRCDPLNHTSTYTYDALNRRASFTDALNGKNTYTYGANDDLTRVADPRGLATTYAHDGLSDQTGATSPDTGASARTFDAAGNVLTSTDARGKVGTYTYYDALNRPLKITWTGGETVTYAYETGTLNLTIQDIERAIDTLSQQQLQELYAWLGQSRATLMLIH
jgi:YD repeat-containing protein